MIWESGYWKDPLLAMGRRLQLAAEAKWQLSDRRLAQVERDMFIGFYSVRKLIHSGPKLTDVVKRMNVNLTSYPNLLPVNLRNWHQLDELYDLHTPSRQSRDLEFVSGRIIHSFVFAPISNEAGGLTASTFLLIATAMSGSTKSRCRR